MMLPFVFGTLSHEAQTLCEAIFTFVCPFFCPLQQSVLHRRGRLQSLGDLFRSAGNSVEKKLGRERIMKVSQWAEIRPQVAVEKLSQRAVALRLRCCQKTVAGALRMDHPPAEKQGPAGGSLLDPWKPKIDALLAGYPQLSAARVMEDIRRGPDGYRGQLTLVRLYLRKFRPRWPCLSGSGVRTPRTGHAGRPGALQTCCSRSSRSAMSPDRS